MQAIMIFNPALHFTSGPAQKSPSGSGTTGLEDRTSEAYSYLCFTIYDYNVVPCKF